ncbi:hypothetical protein CDG79_25525 [Nostoc sp. 'Peltigera membranacea cyanobiont' 232]|nr:hypothetical protein CDG79_25525 [Nostoc sp. 'Peltigera membranacea cyanobiont' 232]
MDMNKLTVVTDYLSSSGVRRIWKYKERDEYYTAGVGESLRSFDKVRVAGILAIQNMRGQ